MRQATGRRTGCGEVLLDLDEDALTRTGERRIDDRLLVARLDGCEAPRAARVVHRCAVLHHVGDAVLEQREHVVAVVDAQAVARAQVLIDPHAHACTLTNCDTNQESEHQ